jgi:hypothetical protein
MPSQVDQLVAFKTQQDAEKLIQSKMGGGGFGGGFGGGGRPRGGN